MRASAIALASTVLTFTVAAACSSIAHGDDNAPHFSITSTISDSAVRQSAAVLLPGISRYLWYTAHNPSNVPLTVRSLSISNVVVPPGCPIANLDYDSTTFNGSLLVPAHGVNSVPVPISLYETHVNQDACENRSFQFTYEGSATYVIVAPTETSVTSSQNPSQTNHAVTYTATVTTDQGHGDSPTGAITFSDGTNVICANVPVIADGVGRSSATCTPPIYVSAGTHPITAVFTNTDGDFSSSTSPVYQQVVRSLTPTSLVLASSPNPSFVGQPVTLSATLMVTPGPNRPTSQPSGLISFYLGTPFLAHTLIGTAPVAASGHASVSTSSLPLGADDLYAAYVGDASYAASTSTVIIQNVASRPGGCQDNYTNWYQASSTTPVVNATTGANFFVASAGTYQFFGFGGPNCFDGGDGNYWFSAGNGHDVIRCGNGTNVVTLGDGNDAVSVGDGTNTLTVGGGNDVVNVGNGQHNRVSTGNGSDVVTVGDGTSNVVTLGNGADTVTIQGGSGDVVTSGSGNDTIFVGSGSNNTFVGSPKSQNVCHVPAPPASWHGLATTYFHDTLTNCSVVVG